MHHVRVSLCHPPADRKGLPETNELSELQAFSEYNAIKTFASCTSSRLAALSKWQAAVHSPIPAGLKRGI